MALMQSKKSLSRVQKIVHSRGVIAAPPTPYTNAFSSLSGHAPGSDSARDSMVDEQMRQDAAADSNEPDSE